MFGLLVLEVLLGVAGAYFHFESYCVVGLLVGMVNWEIESKC